MWPKEWNSLETNDNCIKKMGFTYKFEKGNEIDGNDYECLMCHDIINCKRGKIANLEMQ